MKKEDPEHIGSILKQLFQEPEWKDKLQAAIPLLRWQEIVGVKIAEQSQPESLKDGVLQVRVANSAWLHHLRFLEQDLRHKLNEELPSIEIKELRFRHGPLDTVPPVVSSIRSGDASVPQNCEEEHKVPSKEQLKLLKAVSDPDLRRNLESLLKRQLNRSRR